MDFILTPSCLSGFVVSHELACVKSKSCIPAKLCVCRCLCLDRITTGVTVAALGPHWQGPPRWQRGEDQSEEIKTGEGEMPEEEVGQMVTQGSAEGPLPCLPREPGVQGRAAGSAHWQMAAGRESDPLPALSLGHWLSCQRW